MSASDDFDSAALREGLCPVHRTALERRDGCGWCDECGVGFSASWTGGAGTLSLHIEAYIPDSLRSSGEVE